MGQEELRRKAAEFASSIVGWSADPSTPDHRARYIALVAPGETASAQADMAQMSPGGLVVAGVWRGVGVDAPELRPPYVTGSALSRLSKIARRAGAWVTFALGKLPEPGDAVLIGGDASGPEHMYTVVAVTPGDPAEVRAVAGFKGSTGHPAVIAVTHRWSGRSDTADDPGGGAPIVRNVSGWIDLAKLPTATGVPADRGVGTTSATPPALEERRRRAVALATSILGLGANPKNLEQRRKYLDFVAPGVAPEREGDLALREGSALIASGVLRALGLPPLLDPSEAPARPGPAVPPVILEKPILWALLETYKRPSAFAIASAVERPGIADRLAARPLVNRLPASALAKRFVEGPLASRLAGSALRHAQPDHADPEPAAEPAPSESKLVTFLKTMPYSVTAKLDALDPRAQTDVPASSLLASVFHGELAGQYLRLLQRGRVDGADVRQLVTEARRLGAWVPYARESAPAPGDVVFAGVEGASAGRVYVATSVAGATIAGVESQRDVDGYARVVTRDHLFNDGVDVVVGARDTGTTAPLPIDGWIDVSRLQEARPRPQHGLDPQPDPRPPETIRERAVDIALSLVGVGANPSDPVDRQSYLDVIAPDETPPMQEDMSQMSGCALVVRGIWRALGFDEPELAAPYRIGAAMAHVMTLAHRAGAWVVYAPGKLPRPGDVVLVGNNGREHVFTVTVATPTLDRATLESVDGGQVDADAFQIITARGRTWQGGIDTPTGRTGAARQVQGWVDLERLAKLLDGPTPVITAPPKSESGSWEDYAPEGPSAGKPIAASVVSAIQAKRAAVAAVSDLRPTPGGHFYMGTSDAAHLAYLDARVAARVREAASDEDRMKNASIRMLLRREGTTAAINTYDNMIVTWGMGFAGLGSLPPIFDRAVHDAAVRGFFHDVGLGFWGDAYHVVDLATGRVVSGMKPALQVIRGSVQLLHALIGAAREPATRDVVTDAQFDHFVAHSANHAGAGEIATQALFNFVTHLKHWAPHYAMGAVAWAAAQAGGSRSEARDRALAPLIGRYFYGRTRGYSWVPKWTQFQIYALQHLKADGLDCTGDPWLTAGAPTDLPNVSSHA